MPNKQKMQNYDYFDILDFKDRSDRDRIAIRFISDRDLGVWSRWVAVAAVAAFIGGKFRRRMWSSWLVKRFCGGPVDSGSSVFALNGEMVAV